MKLGPYELNQIYTGDARELSEAIPDNSCDLIFTDPIYSNIEDYEWLAKTAARVLKPDSAVLVWSNGKWHKVNTDWLELGGLTYRWDFSVVSMIVVGGKSKFSPLVGKIKSLTSRVIWMDINHRSSMVDYLKDGYLSYSSSTLDPPFRAISGQMPRYDGKSWGKSLMFSLQSVRAFTHPGAIVFDPFTGGGTVPAVCKMLGRNYLAFEIDPTTADKSRERVLMTQPPLLLPEPVQFNLIEEVQ